MNSMIFNPVEEFDGKFKNLHFENAKKFFEALVERSGVDEEANRKTVKEYESLKASMKKLKRKFNLFRVLRVLACITVILIPLVIWLLTPKIRAMRQELADAEQKLEALMQEAQKQMAPLNALFTARDALTIMETTIPMLSFAPCFSAAQEANMSTNFDYKNDDTNEVSAVDVLAGHYNENPFLFENRLIHEMGVETYHGYKTIRWTESYRDSNGNRRTRTRTQTLHAMVTKPKPFYRTQVLLSYCAQSGNALSFTRDATHLEEKSEKEIERYVKRGEKKLKKLTDEAIKENRDFVSMSNADFEVLFDALDRTNEVQFRALFTPLAQTNMVDLIRSKIGFGDDFNFIKKNRMNRVITTHSQGRAITLTPASYVSYSFDMIKERFITKNAAYFKAMYFDFAPLWAIPAYQERPVHSLDPIPDYAQKYSYKECEVLANLANPMHIVHPKTKTQAIIKASFVASRQGVDEIAVCAHSYDILPRIDFVPVLGGDGRMHAVPVPWSEYVPLEELTHFFVGNTVLAPSKSIVASRGDLCMYR